MIPKSFDDHAKELESISSTWVPALIGVLLRRAVREKIFKDNGALKRFLDLAIKNKK